MKTTSYIILLLCLFLFSACGGGGGDDENLTCPNETPLLCSNSKTCCPRGLSFYCDGICSAVPLTPCAEEEECTFNTRSRKHERSSTIEELLSPQSASAPMSTMVEES